MAETTPTESATTGRRKPKKETIPPEGYICSLCGKSTHWIQQCPEKPNKRKRKKATHEYVPGVDPSPQDIEKAKQMQQLKPPKCDCGIPSRLKKVKRSKVTENSRANGSYFFFCSKPRGDATKCNFARPIQEEPKTDKDKRASKFFAKKRRQSAGKDY